jgi:2,3-bisphosphoglycerate-independent phosphoglycerate mutase
MCGLEHLSVEGEDIEDPPKRVRAKMKRAIDALQTHDFVLLNIKGADEAGHDGDFDRKMRFLEDADEAFKPLLTLKDTLIIITADHSTPVPIKDHSADPVPILIHGQGVRFDTVGQYNELIAYKGGLCRIRGIDVMPIALDLINRTKKFGA